MENLSFYLHSGPGDFIDLNPKRLDHRLQFLSTKKNEKRACRLSPTTNLMLLKYHTRSPPTIDNSARTMPRCWEVGCVPCFSVISLQRPAMARSLDELEKAKKIMDTHLFHD
jgi:hypothetical protein